MQYIIQNNNAKIFDIQDFDLAQTLDCGQAFRWEQNLDGSFSGGALNKPLRLSFSNKTLTLYDVQQNDIEFWINYLDLETDYAKLKKIFSQDQHLSKAVSFAYGTRILKQDSWETLCSFIISQNNNIKRIKGIVSRLCCLYGEKINESFYSFPSAKTLSRLTVEDLSELRAGFRARYIIDAATKVANDEINLDKIATMSLDDARKELMKIVGVGAKVADCTLLFGFYRVECYPVDVWIKRVNKFMFPNGLPNYVLPYAGIAQQYLFHYARVSPEAFEFTDDN